MGNQKPIIKNTLLNVVNDQLTSDSASIPEVRGNYDRLVAQGYSDEEARDFIATILAGEMYVTLKEKQKFDHDRYVNALENLPRIPEYHV